MKTRAPRLKDKVAIVTGAGSFAAGIGIGKAVAILFAREGAKVVLVDNVAERAEDTHRIIAEEGGDSLVCEADLTRSEEAKRVVETTVAHYGGVDVLHNNVGVSVRGNVVQVTEEDWDRILTINLKSILFCSKFAIPEMIKRGGGSIITTASGAGMRGNPNMVAYSTSKGGVIAMSRTMAVQHAKDHIRVNCIAPGTIYTPRATTQNMTEEKRAIRRKAVPLELEGSPWDVGWAAVYLASDEARWVTGVLLPVDGGNTISTQFAYISMEHGW